MIEDAYRTGEAMGLAVWCADQAGPYQTVPYPGQSWRPEGDGTATWSLSILRRSLRAAPDGLPRVSTYTIREVLRDSGASYQRSRTWCPTGTALRRRKAGPVAVTDPDADAKKS